MFSVCESHCMLPVICHDHCLFRWQGQGIRDWISAGIMHGTVGTGEILHSVGVVDHLKQSPVVCVGSWVLGLVVQALVDQWNEHLDKRFEQWNLTKVALQRKWHPQNCSVWVDWKKINRMHKLYFFLLHRTLFRVIAIARTVVGRCWCWVVVAVITFIVEIIILGEDKLLIIGFINDGFFFTLLLLDLFNRSKKINTFFGEIGNTKNRQIRLWERIVVYAICHVIVISSTSILDESFYDTYHKIVKWWWWRRRGRSTFK